MGVELVVMGGPHLDLCSFGTGGREGAEDGGGGEETMGGGDDDGRDEDGGERERVMGTVSGLEVDSTSMRSSGPTSSTSRRLP